MKRLLLLLLLTISFAASSQTLLSSVPLQLSKPADRQEALTAVDSATTQMVVFAADKEKVSAFQFNRVLFFHDSLSVPRPEKSYEFMAGYSFSNNVPTVYWASADMKKILGMSVDFATGQTTRVPFTMSFDDSDILASFSANNSFYIVTLHSKEDKLVFYSFADGKYASHEVDMANAGLTSESGRKSSFRGLKDRFGFEKIDRRGFTDLVTASSKIKLYDTPKGFVLTIDTNPAFTHVITIDGTSFTMSQKLVAQPSMDDDADANSFYLDQKLYQFITNKEMMAVRANDLDANTIIATHAEMAGQPIAIANTPLLSVSGNRSPQQLKDTERFLRRVASGTPALSVYRTPDDIRMMVGGMRTYVSAGDVMLGGALILAGGNPGGGDLDIETVWFETLFDDAFNHRPFVPNTLAGDRIAQFNHDIKNLSLINVVPFRNFYVMGYYDAHLKRYVLREFEDDRAY